MKIDSLFAPDNNTECLYKEQGPSANPSGFFLERPLKIKVIELGLTEYKVK